MKKIFMTLAVVATLSLATAGCADGQWSAGQKQTVGTVGGAVVGGVLASNIGGGKGQLWATGAGTLLGAFIGSEIGKSLDRADMIHASRATEQAYTAPIGERIDWKNPESGNYGHITPVREGHTQAGEYCRQYQQTIVVDGQAETAYGTACKQPDGTWVLVN
ncbi:MAG: glycine zipper 2TM domain-containing protein [Micavibrio sp.]|nr:MAG: glycine zipper 2TM domain-containing protein [Micavibrio sp.]